MRLHPTTMVNTSAPATICGTIPNFYSQRVRSWDMSEFIYAYEFVRLLFTTKHHTFVGTVVTKAFQLYQCFTLLVDVFKIPIFVGGILVDARLFFFLLGISFFFQTSLLLLWDFLAFRRCPHRLSNVFPLLTYQLYRILVQLIRFLGLIRALTVYLPNFTPTPTIREIENAFRTSPKQGETVPVWLDRVGPYKHYFEHYYHADADRQLIVEMAKSDTTDDVTSTTEEDHLEAGEARPDLDEEEGEDADSTSSWETFSGELRQHVTRIAAQPDDDGDDDGDDTASEQDPDWLECAIL